MANWLWRWLLCGIRVIGRGSVVYSDVFCGAGLYRHQEANHLATENVLFLTAMMADR